MQQACGLQLEEKLRCLRLVRSLSLKLVDKLGEKSAWYFSDVSTHHTPGDTIEGYLHIMPLRLFYLPTI